MILDDVNNTFVCCTVPSLITCQAKEPAISDPNLQKDHGKWHLHERRSEAQQTAALFKQTQLLHNLPMMYERCRTLALAVRLCHQHFQLKLLTGQPADQQGCEYGTCSLPAPKVTTYLGSRGRHMVHRHHQLLR
jgi:hypothetical protein